jgi:hypothetical protein
MAAPLLVTKLFSPTLHPELVRRPVLIGRLDQGSSCKLPLISAPDGLVPTPYQSGDQSREQGITKAGNHLVRAVAIEIAWTWLCYQPQNKLSLWY